jgi:hypothetical protein
MSSRVKLLAFSTALLLAAAFHLRERDPKPSLEKLSSLPAEVPVPAPSPPIVSLELCEDLSEEVSRSLHELSVHLERRDGRGAEDFFSPAFRAADWGALEASPAEELPLAVRRTSFTPALEPLVGARDFLAGVRRRLRDFEEIEFVSLRFDRADFEAGEPMWGRLRMTCEWSGLGPGQSAQVLLAKGFAKVSQAGKRWYLQSFELLSLEHLERPRRIFTDVTRSAGVYVKERAIGRHEESWSGCAAGDVNGDALLDLFVPGLERNRLYVALPAGGFREEAAALGVEKPAGGTGAVFFDFDNDGDQDLLVADISWLERDGSPRGSELRLYRNELSTGNARFVDASRETGLAQRRYSTTLTVLDHDQDGFLDVFVGNYGRQTGERNESWVDARNGQRNQLFRNVAGRRFEDVGERAGVADPHWTYASAAADYDRDGDADLYVVNDFGPNRLLRNEGDGTFRDVTDDVLSDHGFGMSASWCDLDNDGLLDLYISNMWSETAQRILARLSLGGPEVALVKKLGRGNSLMLGRAGGRFELAPVEFGATEGRWAWGSPPLDVDLDGRLDLFCTNGFITGPEPGDALTWYWRNVVASSIPAENEPSILVRQQVSDPALNRNLRETVWKQKRSYAGRERDKLWVNGGAAGFLDLSSLSGADLVDDGRAVIAADFDDDGDPDLFVTGIQLERHHLLRNDAADPAGRFLKVSLRATRSHPQAVGAEVRIHGPAGPCSQVVAIGSQYLSCQPTELLFGLGGAPSAKVEVFWPGGAREEFGPVKAGSRVRLVEGDGAPEYLELRPRSLHS